MRLGINLMAWSGTVGPDERALLPDIAALGYHGVELPILVPDAFDAPAARQACEAAGLLVTASTAMPLGASLLVPAERDAGVAFLDHCSSVAAACGASVVCGPLYAPIGAMPGRPRTSSEWDSCVVGLRSAGDRAAAYGVVLAVEPLNRFETHFLNTVDDALALLDEVDHPAVGLHLDTFHQNIEEKNVAEAVVRSRRHLRHVHASENDRGVIGSGHVDWLGLRDALRSVAYDGWVVAETFASRIPEIATATSIWRPIVPDGWTYARESIEFMRGLLPGDDA
jgi:D-psicose/D-tagatose/L-ribulose 3-epimerase